MKKERVQVDFQKSLERLDFGLAKKYGKELDKKREMKKVFPGGEKA